MAVLCRFECSDALFGDGDVDGSGVGRVGAAGDESVGLQPGDHPGNTALAERRAATQFAHLQSVIVCKDRQEEQNLELVKAQPVFLLQCAIKTTDQNVARSH